jgi:uncharacterized protein YcbK (DUF882 family)
MDRVKTVSAISRRRFVCLAAVGGFGLAAPDWVAASASSRELRFAHLHTGERLTVEYFNAGSYQADGLAAIDRLLRDFRTGEVHAIDPKLLDLLHVLGASTRSRRPFQVISGYRSPATNEMLRSRSEGVAAGSLHLKGQAVDIRLADVRLADLRDAAIAAALGGVGYYQASNFVHVDCGRPRRW